MKKLGFTDKCYLYNVAFVTVIVAMSFYTMLNSMRLQISDLSPIGYIIPSAFGELALHTALIVWKAKIENCRKHKDVNRIQQIESEV